MIGSLRGTLLERAPNGEVIVEVAGVGYRVLVPPGTLAMLGTTGSQVLLHTHLHVREDALTLFGFNSRDERRCFEALIGAHGVGPSLGLAILSVHRPDALRRALVEDDTEALCLVPGVGRKTAVRLMLELKARLEVLAVEVAGTQAADGAGGRSARSEVRQALVALGYGPAEVGEAVTAGLAVDGDVAQLLKQALAHLGAVRPRA